MRREIIRKRIAAQKAAEEAEQKAAEQANRDREDAELDKLTEEMGRAAIDRCIMIMQKACMCNVYREREREMHCVRSMQEREREREMHCVRSMHSRMQARTCIHAYT